MGRGGGGRGGNTQGGRNQGRGSRSGRGGRGGRGRGGDVYLGTYPTSQWGALSTEDRKRVNEGRK